MPFSAIKPARLFLLPLTLLLIFCRAYAQDAAPGFESAMALNEPAARAEALQKLLDNQTDVAVAEKIRVELTKSYAALGETQLVAKNIDQALQTFHKAIEAFPKEIDDDFFEGVVTKLPLAVSVRGYRTEAILLSRDLEPRFAQKAERLSRLGEFYLGMEAPADAVRVLTASLKLAPDSAPTLRTLGNAYRMNLNIDKAAIYFQQAIKADPKEPRAYFELANIYRALGRQDEAIKLYQQQFDIDPQHPGSLKGMALALLSLGKDSESEETLARAARLSGVDLRQDFFLQTQLALIYLSRQNTAKARASVDLALAAEPRYSWARIAAAEVDLAENNIFNAEKNLIAALRFSDFPTIHFELAKVYILAEDFDGALEQLAKVCSYKNARFQTLLGGFVQARSDSLVELLAPEREATIFHHRPPGGDIEFRLAENLIRFEEAIKASRQQAGGTVSALVLSQNNEKLAMNNIDRAAMGFADVEGSRRPFRWLYIAGRLLQLPQGAEGALKYSDLALDLAEAATSGDGSLRDLPNIDKASRLGVFRGRSLSLRGKALLKLGKYEAAAKSLSEAVDSFGTFPERKLAQWQLAKATESLGKREEALAMYLEAYEPPAANAFNSDLNRILIEGLYKKVYGSLDGLNEKIGRPRDIVAARTPEPEKPATTTEPAAAAASETPRAETATAEKVTTEAKEAETAAVPAAIIVLPEAKIPTPILEMPASIGTESELAMASEDSLPPGMEAPAPKLIEIVELPSVTNIPLFVTTSVLPVPELAGDILNLLAEESAPLEMKAENDIKAEVKADELIVPPQINTPQKYALTEFSLVQVEVAPNLEEAADSPPAVAPSVGAAWKTSTAQKEGTKALSDSKVAEIERSIDAAAAPGGKKGDRGVASEESAIGHIEGDRPVRTNPKPAIEVLPSGESGHMGTEKPRDLPQDVEKRLENVGKMSGKLSSEAVKDLDAPDKASSKKGAKEKDSEKESSDSDSKSRPRKVGEKPQQF